MSSASLVSTHRAALLRPQPLTLGRKRAALAIAAIADLTQIVLFPFFIEGALSPFEDVLDGVVAITLLFVVGFQWRLALALAIELAPGLDLFPTWTALVASLPAAPAAPPAASHQLPR